MIKHVIGIVLLLVGAGAVYLFALPGLEDARAMQESVGVLESLISKTEELNSVGSAVIERYQTVEDRDLRRVNALVPDKIDNVKLILEIQKLAERFGLSVQRIDVSGTGVKDYAGQVINIVSFDAEILGFYNDFVDFMEELELSERIIDPSSISFQALDSESGFSFNLSVDTYWK